MAILTQYMGPIFRGAPAKVSPAVFCQYAGTPSRRLAGIVDAPAAVLPSIVVRAYRRRGMTFIGWATPAADGTFSIPVDGVALAYVVIASDPTLTYNALIFDNVTST